MKFQKTFLLLLYFAVSISHAQLPEISSNTKMSLLTVGNADELHSKFGHSAIRIQGLEDGSDIVFGYGGFDFNDPNFYYKFTTGKLDYNMTGHRFNDFVEGYKIENRTVHEQELNLTQAEKETLYNYLRNNYRPENRSYKYDFLFDNCATKIPEVLKFTFGESLSFDDTYIKKESTFRQLIHETLDTNSWSAFGIDLALGAVIDRKATPWEHQFLPEYVSAQFEHTSINGKPLCDEKKLLLDVKPTDTSKSILTTPAVTLSILLLLVALVTFLDFKKKKRSKWLDFLLFFVSGVAGLIICFLWFATNHTSTKMNFNILWAVAPNLIIAFFLLNKKIPKWLHKYLKVLLGGIAALLLLWVFKIQIFSPLILLILAALIIRYLFLIKRSKQPLIK